MAHTIVPVPKKAIAKFSEVCELHAGHDEDVSPCSHWDHCERKAVIWVYDYGGSPFIYGLCNQCYAWTMPCSDREYWYRVVKVSEEFRGVL